MGTGQTRRKKFRLYRKRYLRKILLIVVVAAVCIAAAAIGVKAILNYSPSGEFEVAVPTAEQMANIADNWEILNTHTDKILNYYTLLGGSEDGTDGSGNVVLIYTGHEDIEEISILVLTGAAVTDVTASGAYICTSVEDFINGVAPWNQAAKQIVATNGKCAIVVYDVDTQALDGAILAEVIAELEAIIAEGPVETTETFAEGFRIQIDEEDPVE